MTPENNLSRIFHLYITYKEQVISKRDQEKIATKVLHSTDRPDDT